MHLCASRKLETLDRPQQPRLLSQWLALQTVSEAKVLRTNREARTAVAESAADEAAEAAFLRIGFALFGVFDD